MKQTAHLEDWSVYPYFKSDVLKGTVTGHPLLKDGTVVVTTILISIDEVAGTAETKNTNYTLGKKYSGA